MADIVYVVGAGANQSVEAWGGLKPPLARNFFQVALQGEKFSGDHSRQRIKAVYDFIYRYYKRTKEQLSTEPFDLEELFTLLELQRRQAYREGNQNQLTDLVNIEFLLKSFFAEYLSEFELHAVRSQSMRDLGAIIYRDAAPVITFNYDCILEPALEHASGVRAHIPESFVGRRLNGNDVPDEELEYSHFNWNRPLAYGLEFSEVQLQRAGIPTYVDGSRFYAHPANQPYDAAILKLHGSLNWFRVLPIRRFPSFGEAPPELSEARQGAVVLVRGHWWFAEPPDLDGWLIEPLLITPVLDKERFLSQPIFTHLWARAKAELSRCRRLVIVGYSFPPTDFHTRRLFLEAFVESPPAEVILVNPDPAIADAVLNLTHAPRLFASCATVEEYVRSFPAPPSPSPPPHDFRPGDRVTVTTGRLAVGGIELTGNVFGGVTIARKNQDGTYQVRGIISTPDGDELTIPADWIHPYNAKDG